MAQRNLHELDDGHGDPAGDITTDDAADETGGDGVGRETHHKARCDTRLTGDGEGDAGGDDDRQHAQGLATEGGERFQEVELAHHKRVLAGTAEGHTDGNDETGTAHDWNHVRDCGKQVPLKIGSLPEILH